MYFSGSEALWGLLLLAVPLIVHFFSLRKAKRVYFPDLRFLRQITEVTKHRETLRRRLVLTMRLLALLAAVLMFAGWAIDADSGKSSDSGVTSIFLDNSPSTALFAKEGSLLDEMRETVANIARQSSPAERFQLITSELRPGEQQLLTKEELLSELAAVKPGSSTRSLAQILERQKNAIHETKANGNRYILSDFQNSFSDWKTVKSDTTLTTTLLHFQAASQKNLFIDSAWMASPVLIPGQTATMVVRVNNTGQEETITAPWVMELDGQSRLTRNLTIPGNSRKLDSIVFQLPKAGWHSIRLSLRDHPVTFDDQYYYSLYLRERIKVLVISQQLPSNYLQSFFEQEPFLDVRYVKAEEFNPEIAEQAQVIFCEGLNQPSNGLAATWVDWLKPGKSLLLIPGLQADVTAWSSVINPITGGSFQAWKEVNARVRMPSLKEPFLSGVFNNISNQADWPEVKKALLPSSNSGSGLREILSLESGGGLLYQSLNKGAHVYWMSTPLDLLAGNFPAHPLFVPVLYRICLTGTGSQQLTATSGQAQQLPLELKLEQEQVILAGDRKQGRLPLLYRQGGQLAISFQNDRPWESGFYPLYIKGQDSVRGILAMNRQSEESELSFPDTKVLQREANARGFKLESVINPAAVNTQSAGQQVQKMAFWLCLIALLALLAESILIRYQPWKKSLSTKPE